MCFSPQGDLAAGVVVTAIGVDACLHIHERKDKALIAVLPVLLGLHQIDESLVWFGLRNEVPPGVGRAAMWIYLAVALVVLPAFVPTAVLALEPDSRRRRLIVPFVVLGIAVAIVLLVTMLVNPVTVSQQHLHLAYSIGLPNGVLVVGLYVLATCGSVLLSSYKHVVLFGVVNLVAVAVLARLTADGFTSLWCAYAAVTGAAIALHVRYATWHHDALRLQT
jgi:hypothetical protein